MYVCTSRYSKVPLLLVPSHSGRYSGDRCFHHHHLQSLLPWGSSHPTGQHYSFRDHLQARYCVSDHRDVNEASPLSMALCHIVHFSQAMSHVLQPSQTMLYTWEDPCGKKELIWHVAGMTPFSNRMVPKVISSSCVQSLCSGHLCCGMVQYRMSEVWLVDGLNTTLFYIDQLWKKRICLTLPHIHA